MQGGVKMCPVHEEDYNKEIEIEKSITQFIFPFSFKKERRKHLMERLKEEHYTHFSLKDQNLETQFYGPHHHVSHFDLDQYFLPYIEQILFPSAHESDGFHRFSKPLQCTGILETRNDPISFEILSIDIFICPYHIGMINIRVQQTKEKMVLTDTLDFMNHFRVLEPKLAEQKGSKVCVDDQVYEKVQELIFYHLCPFLVSFVDEREVEDAAYFGSLPYFVDERMYVIGYISVKDFESINDVHLYRVGNVNGYDERGRIHVAATNPSYIEKINKKQVYDRWAPHTYYVTSDHVFCCLTHEKDDQEEVLASGMLGQHYYNLLLHFYYKVVLLKLSYEHSLLRFQKDEDEIEGLISSISVFSAKYLFSEISSRTEGQEFAEKFKEVFHIDSIYMEVKETLLSLYQNQEKLIDKRHNYLLFIMTIYTVISGIYGMNLVIDDWKGSIHWHRMLHYSFFEYISLLIAISGIFIGLGMGIAAVIKLLTRWMKGNQFM